MKSFDGDSLRIEATDPREARYVNMARYGAQSLGASARKVVEAVMQIGNPRRSRINLSENRRLVAALHLENAWAIRCEDLVNVERRRVRLVSSWTFDKQQRSPHVSPTKTTGDLIGRGLETRKTDTVQEAIIPWLTD